MPKNNDLVSVVMPAYNCTNYIGKSIESILKQTYSKLQLIVIDDGSNDDTLKVIKKYAEQDSRVKVFKNEKNSGVSATRNRGISIAEGEWIAFLDSDDIWTESKLEKQMKYAERVNAEFIFTGSSYINEEGKPYKGVFDVPEKVTYEKLLKQNVITCSSVLIKKKFFKNIKMEKDEMHEDYAVWLRILRLGVTAYALNEPLIIYRISKGSKSGKKINTIKMTYRVFRFIGINRIGSTYFMIQHVLRSFVKYKRIKNI